MDAKTAERINQLAHSLRELHLAASMEEAIKRAREIILGTPEKEEKSIKELFEDVDSKKEEKTVESVKEIKAVEKEIAKDIKELAEDIESDIKAGEKAKEDIAEAKEILKEDTEMHKVGKADVEETKEDLEKVEEALFAFAEKESVDVVFGSKNKIRIKETETLKFPSKSSKERFKLEKLLKDNGIWQDVDQLDTAALNKILSEKKIDEKLIEEINRFIKLERSKRAYMSKI